MSTTVGPSRTAAGPHGNPQVATAVRVLAIPAGHRYARAVYPVDIEVRADPTNPWWPHAALEVGHLRTIADHVDVVHLHFGFEHRTREQLSEWVEEVHRLGLVLVFTVHDLANPNVADVDDHLAHLDVLVPGADHLITLTSSAADEISERWGRRPHVVEHPPLLTFGPTGVDPEEGLIGVHFKRVRPGTMPVAAAAPSLVEAARSHGARLRMSIDRTADTGQIADLVAWRRVPDVVVVVDDHRPDGDFATSLARLAVSVLPYRSGTHSGWLEACRDVGTRVVAPDCGHYASQWSDVETFACVDQRWDDETLSRAIGRALLRPAPPVPSMGAQFARLRRVARQHRELLVEASRGRRW